MMLLAERAGRKLERWSNSAPRGMAVIAQVRLRRNKIRPIGLLQLITRDEKIHTRAGPGDDQFARHPV